MCNTRLSTEPSFILSTLTGMAVHSPYNKVLGIGQIKSVGRVMLLLFPVSLTLNAVVLNCGTRRGVKQWEASAFLFIHEMVKLLSCSSHLCLWLSTLEIAA